MAVDAGSSPETSGKIDVRSRAVRRREWWHITAAEARMHARVMAVVLWAVAALILTTGSTYRNAFGSLKGTDFVHFYTLAHVDTKHASAVLYAPEALHRLQTSLVPESAPERYLFAYPPHAALLFRPFAALSYGEALAAWMISIAAGYALCVWLAWRPSRSILADTGLVFAAAAAFPPFWYLALHGQTTLVPMLAFAIGWLALEHDRPFVAGAAFGLLLLKPQFALVLVVVAVYRREWRMISGAAAAIAFQIAITIAIFGVGPWREYIGLVMNFSSLQGALEPRPTEMHSLAAITGHLRGVWGGLVWVAGAVFIVVQTVRTWRASVPPSLRMACLVVASMLVNPHLNSYDVTVLALPLIWYAAWVFGEPGERRLQSVFVCLVYATYLTVLAPTARLVPGLQASVIVLLALFVLMARAAQLSLELAPVPARGVTSAQSRGFGQ